MTGEEFRVEEAEKERVTDTLGSEKDLVSITKPAISIVHLLTNSP